MGAPGRRMTGRVRGGAAAAPCLARRRLRSGALHASMPLSLSLARWLSLALFLALSLYIYIYIYVYTYAQ